MFKCVFNLHLFPPIPEHILRILKSFLHPHKAALPIVFFALTLFSSIQLKFRFHTTLNKTEIEIEIKIKIEAETETETETESRSRTVPSVCRVSLAFRFVFKLKLTRRNEKLA